jgi:hypothetical protein
MDKVLKQDSSKCITPSSEPFRIEKFVYAKNEVWKHFTCRYCTANLFLNTEFLAPYNIYLHICVYSIRRLKMRLENSLIMCSYNFKILKTLKLYVVWLQTNSYVCFHFKSARLRVYRFGPKSWRQPWRHGHPLYESSFTQCPEWGNYELLSCVVLKCS